MEWLLTTIWYIIVAIILYLVMAMVTALGALTGVFLIAAISLLGVGFSVYSLGFQSWSIKIWLASGIFTLASFVTMVVFIKALIKQRKREEHDDWLKGNF